VKYDAFTEEREADPAEHLALDHLDLVDVALHGAGAVGQGEPGGDGLLVAADAVGEGVQLGLVVGLDAGECSALSRSPWPRTCMRQG
jgi:NAD(P)H-hydrate repair Nnr-like enzyme with NAD(P)H-hydrate epimerase domain